MRVEGRAGGRYRVEHELARGGMGVVFAAVDELNGTRVALKRLRPSHVGSVLPQLFAREYYTLARLRHPHIIEVYDYGSDEQGPFYTMELLDGRDLSEASPLPYRQACAYLRDIASSLSLLHSHRLVHRDLSARNVRLTGDGHAKLLDFGALTHFGVATELVGTAAFVAPEVLRGAGVDHRADLFGLGALAYWTLTGRHAYPASTFDGLRLAFRQPCAPPSQLVAEVPRELDTLVMSLLALDSLARPMSAAEVIERLSVIAALPAEASDAVARSYLLSGVFVGRERELHRLCGHLQETLRGHGGAVVIEAPEGLGRTRLAEELLLQAQLLGMPAAFVESSLHSGAYSTLAALVRATSERLPEARAVFERRVDRLPDAVRAVLTRHEYSAGLGRPMARRTRGKRRGFRNALRACFLELLEMTPLLLVVDDLHRADEDSRAVLALLALAAPRQRLALVLTSPSRTSRSLAAVESAVDRIALTELTWPDVEALTSSLFSGAQHAGRCARRLHAVTRGNPKQYMELAQHLVDSGLVTYLQGTWVLPHDLPEELMPRNRPDELMERLQGLSADAMNLAQTLSIHRCPVDLPLCLELMGDSETDRTHRALGELIMHGVLRARASSYEFMYRGLREQLVEQLPPQRRIELHRALGEILVHRGADDPEQRLEAGFHLLHGGQDRIGGDLLVASAQQLLADLRAVHLAADSLAIAYEMYSAQGRNIYERLRVGTQLVIAAYYVDPQYGHRFAKQVFHLAMQATGCAAGVTNGASAVASSVERARAAHAEAYAAAVEAGTQHNFLGFDECFAALFQVATFWNATMLASLVFKDLGYLAKALRPAAQALGETYALRFLYADSERVLATVRGELTRAHGLLRQSREWLERGDLPAVLADTRPKLLAINTFLLGHFAAYRDGDAACQYATELERLGHPFFVAQAAYLRSWYHLYRGEATIASSYRLRVEHQAIGGAATWQFAGDHPLAFAAAYYLTGDVVSLATVVDLYGRLIERRPLLASAYETVRAYLHLQRGQAELALLAAERALTDENTAEWGWHHIAYTAALNRTGRHAQAIEVCLRAHSRDTDPFFQRHPCRVATECELAIARASTGDMAEGLRVIEDALVRFADMTNPLMIGMLHETRAQLAERCSDATSVAKHVALARAAFQSTDNPPLIARAQRLGKEMAHGSALQELASGQLVTLDEAARVAS